MTLERSSSSPAAAFTVIELMMVMGIIIILAGFVVTVSGYVQEKGKRSRAETEIAAISAALESYKADNGIYPAHPAIGSSGHALYQALTGDGDDAIGGTRPSTGTAASANKSYMPLRSAMQTPNPPDATTRVIDPWVSDYNYQCPGVNNPPTFDLWSTGPPGSPVISLKNW